MMSTAFSSGLAILNVMKAPILLMITLGNLLISHAMADSKRIEVYPLTQTYWDVRYGESLSEIAATLLPHNPGLQQQLMQDIIKMNPAVFVDRDAHKMLAERRIWLPNSMMQPDNKTKPGAYKVESFSWGNVKRHK